MKGMKNRVFKLLVHHQASFWQDISSGLTVALALIPEAIAFAFVAHVDPIIGLHAACIMAIVTAIFGGRPGMISGATGAMAVIFAPLVISQTQLHGMPTALSYLFVAVILMGVIQVLCGLLRLGKFIRLVPHPVMIGFVNGLAIIIFLSQLELFKVVENGTEDWLTGEPLWIMLGLILLTMGTSYLLPKLSKKIPATLVAILGISLLSYFLRKGGVQVRTVLDFVQSLNPDQTSLSAHLPVFKIPQGLFEWQTLWTVLPYSLLGASVGLIESLMTLRLVDEITETRGSSNKECIGQGIANILSGWGGSMGGCAMIGQSMINIRSGGRTRVSQLTAGVALLLFIVCGSQWVELIPLPALVGVMFMVVLGTFEWGSFRLWNKVPFSDVFVIILVTSLTVCVDLAIAVFVGLLASCLVFAWKKSTKIYVQTSEDHSDYKVYAIEGSLFFASVTHFKELFDFKNDPQDICIDFAQATIYDHSAIEAINFISERYAKYNTKVHLVHLQKECASLIKKAANIVEVRTYDTLDDWKIADDRLES